MKNPLQTAKNHLDNSQMTYWYHCRHSLVNCVKLLWLAGSSFIHAFFPFVLQQHAAKGIIRIYKRMQQYAHIRRTTKEMENE